MSEDARADLIAVLVGALCLPLGLAAWHRSRRGRVGRRAWWILPLTIVPVALCGVFSFGPLGHPGVLSVAMLNALGLVALSTLIVSARAPWPAILMFATTATAALALVGVLGRALLAGPADPVTILIAGSFGVWLLGVLWVARSVAASESAPALPGG